MRNTNPRIRSISIDPELYYQVKQAANEEHTTVSSIITELLKTYIKNKKPTK